MTSEELDSTRRYLERVAGELEYARERRAVEGIPERESDDRLSEALIRRRVWFARLGLKRVEREEASREEELAVLEAVADLKRTYRPPTDHAWAMFILGHPELLDQDDH
jgi:hypothetical protein